MCEPVTISLIAMGVATAASAAGTGMMMYGQYQQGKAAEKAGEYNAKIKEMQADSVAEQASFDARQRVKQNQRDVSKGLVSAAGSGLSLTSGSVLDWEGDMEDALGTDLAAIEHNSELQQFSLKSGAAIDRAEGKFAKKASYWQMGSTALGSTGQIAGSWGSYSAA